MAIVPLDVLRAVYAEAQQALAQGTDPRVVARWTMENTGIANIDRLGREIARRSAVVGGTARAAAEGALMGGLGELYGLGAAMVPGGEGFDARDAVEGRLAEFRADHPVLATAGELAGGLAMPGLGVAKTAARAPSILGAAARSGLGAGMVGAVSGAAGAGEVLDGTEGDQVGQPRRQAGSRLRGGLLGGAIGLGAGALLGGVGGAVAQREATRAGRRLGAALEEAGGAEAVRPTAELMERGAPGINVPADWSPRLRGELDWAMRANPAVATEVAPALMARRGGSAQRLAEGLSEPFGGRPLAGEQLAGLKLAQRTAGEAYDAIPEGVLHHPVVHEMLTRPVIKTAFQSLKTLGQMADDAPLEPSVRNTIGVYRRLKGMATAAFKNGETEAGELYAKTAKELETALRQELPEFAALNANYYTASAALRAAKLGLRWARVQDGAELARTVRTLSPSELQEFRRALAAGIVRDLVNGRTSRKVAKEFIEGGEHIARKLEIVFGSQKAAQRFLDRARAEFFMDLTTMVGQNSITTASGIAQKLDPSLLSYAGSRSGVLDRVIGSIGRRMAGNQQILQNAETARAMQPMMTQPQKFEDWLAAVQRRSATGAGLLLPMAAGAGAGQPWQ